ncbi:ankyrin repeat domain-containing protein [Leptospira ryugenii]|uniref:ankyrin repeat domain-containing protein n=1 Tax=Leptospira ryugenii TaxID=1917863 RepID=UPI000D597AEF|nr:ankyrin repeat domain-containing protein [Leptospira ryugenii]
MSSNLLLDWKKYSSWIMSFGLLFIFHCGGEEQVKKDPIPLEIRFFRAVDAGDVNLVEELLQKGVPINQKDPLGNSALIRATDHEKRDLVLFLLSRGANINHRNLVGETALYRAVFRGNIDLVKLLVEKGAETKIKNAEGLSPMALADERGEEGIQIYLESIKK